MEQRISWADIAEQEEANIIFPPEPLEPQQVGRDRCVAPQNRDLTIRCENPVHKKSTEYCINHRQQCKQLYANYKNACSGLSFTVCDLNKIQQMSIANLQQYVNRVSANYARALACLNARKKHNDQCYSLECRDEAHRRFIGHVEDAAYICNNFLVQARARLAAEEAKIKSVEADLQRLSAVAVAAKPSGRSRMRAIKDLPKGPKGPKGGRVIEEPSSPKRILDPNAVKFVPKFRYYPSEAIEVEEVPITPLIYEQAIPFTETAKAFITFATPTGIISQPVDNKIIQIQTEFQQELDRILNILYTNPNPRHRAIQINKAVISAIIYTLTIHRYFRVEDALAIHDKIMRCITNNIPLINIFLESLDPDTIVKESESFFYYLINRQTIDSNKEFDKYLIEQNFAFNMQFLTGPIFGRNKKDQDTTNYYIDSLRNIGQETSIKYLIDIASEIRVLTASLYYGYVTHRTKNYIELDVPTFLVQLFNEAELREFINLVYNPPIERPITTV